MVLRDLRTLGINTNNKVFIVAEIGLNHGGDLVSAKNLIDSAARAGADAVKFQTYITEKRVPDDSPIFAILKKCELPFEAFGELKDHADKAGVEFFSTPFDEESVDYLESIGVRMYKIASFDVVNKPMLRRVAQTGKTVLLSVGMSNRDEIQTAYDILRQGTDKVSLLHCISAYPTCEEDANLAALWSLKNHFDCVIGQSDHTCGIRVPLYAVAAGAQIIEKHYKLTDDMECVDAPVSVSEQQMKAMVEEIRRIEKIIGSGVPGVTTAQRGTLQFRRQCE